MGWSAHTRIENGGPIFQNTVEQVENNPGRNKTRLQDAVIRDPNGNPLSTGTNSEAYVSLGAASNREVGTQTPDPDPTSAATHADIRIPVDFLPQQIDTELEDHRNDVRNTVRTAVER